MYVCVCMYVYVCVCVYVCMCVSVLPCVSSANVNVPVEMLIRSHDCFTYSCCVDGISEVLIVAKQWTDILLGKENFKLMVGLGPRQNE